MVATARKWDIEAGVVVLGTGGAGLTAAILAADQGAKVVVLERTDKVGGTTAVSGGSIWIPLHHHQAEAGVQDSREEALTYCKRLTNGRVPDELVETFVDEGHQMVRYLEEHTPVRFQNWTGSGDDYPLEPGGKADGRALESELFDTNELGEWKGKVRPSHTFLIPMPLVELLFARMEDLPMDIISERMEKGIVATGNALIGRLLKGCLDRGVTILLETRGREIVQENGRIAGVRAERDGKDLFVKASGGVVMASGGFEWNERLKAKFLPGRLSNPISPPFQEGDALLMSMEVGADLGCMSEVWGAGRAAMMPGEEYEGRPLSRLFSSVSPHSILVDRHGKRFYNEMLGMAGHDHLLPFNYSDLNYDPAAFGYRKMRIWCVFDRQHRETTPILTVMPTDPDPSWMLKDDTLEGLAAKVGIDPAGLRETVARFNEFARNGEDKDFHRGEARVERASPGSAGSLGTIEKGPFYALEVFPSVISTKGGPLTNSKGQVVNPRGEVIPGLYAAGNAAASVTGESYWGNGASIGTGMTWGYLCGISAGRDAK